MNYTNIVIKINGTLDNGNDKDIAACNGRMDLPFYYFSLILFFRSIIFFFFFLYCSFSAVISVWFSFQCGALYALAFWTKRERFNQYLFASQSNCSRLHAPGYLFVDSSNLLFHFLLMTFFSLHFHPFTVHWNWMVHVCVRVQFVSYELIVLYVFFLPVIAAFSFLDWAFLPLY